MNAANPGRVAAARALMAVEEGAHLEDALAEHAPSGTDRQGSDRTLSWFLAYGVLRRRSHVDGALRACLRQPLATLDAPVRAALRVGAFEKLFARTKAHAVVHQSVEVARRLGAGRASSMVNAVLRRVGPVSDLSHAETLDHPAWLVDRWAERYGAEQTEAWCVQNTENPPLFVVERTPGAVLEALGDAAEPVDLGGQPLPGVYRVSASGPVTRLPGFDDGAFWVQDAAAVAVADLVGVEEGTRVLDACAAPGGKSFRMASSGARVVAVDRDPGRLQQVRDGATRVGVELAGFHVHDWRTGSIADLGTFDAVLVDAPCSGLGTIRRHPEIRWRRVEADLAAAAGRQGAILAAASTHVAPGGVLVYAVCSPEPEEGAQVVDAFVAGGGFTLESTWSSAPPTNGEDAHWAARMRRQAP